ncbi:hypothetical protein [Aeromicrobium sp. UC242_57]|uniref:hypothetical protein n=1 Tax=Aeromicrobium sp. UC242_57 TaxID=3374624 RepID=UPI00379101E9
MHTGAWDWTTANQAPWWWAGVLGLAGAVIGGAIGHLSRRVQDRGGLKEGWRAVAADGCGELPLGRAGDCESVLDISPDERALADDDYLDWYNRRVHLMNMALYEVNLLAPDDLAACANEMDLFIGDNVRDCAWSGDDIEEINKRMLGLSDQIVDIVKRHTKVARHFK